MCGKEWDKMGHLKRFRGSYELKLDDRGRVKIPARYLSILEEQYGKEIYITSLNGDHVLMYPLIVWEGIEQSIEKIPVRSPEIEEFIDRTGFWGNESEVDTRGRILIPPELRNAGKLHETVRIIGKIDYMVMWNDELFREKAVSGEFGPDKLQKVSQLLNQYSGRSS